MEIKRILTALVLCSASLLFSQRNTSGYWQQHVDYTMEVKMDVETFNYSGTQQLIYTNNSPD